MAIRQDDLEALRRFAPGGGHPLDVRSPGSIPGDGSLVGKISPQPVNVTAMRQFDTGATRHTDENKYDYEGFLQPLVEERFAAYMHKHRCQADGTLRASDNWQKGIPKTVYMKSAFRHFMDVWKAMRGYKIADTLEDALCALLFNVRGLLFEILKEKNES